MKSGKMILFLVILATVCTLILGGFNLLFEKYSIVFSIRLYKVVFDMFEIPYDDDAKNEVIDTLFKEKFDIETHGSKTYYIKKDDKILLCKGEGSGLWSRIEVLLAVNPDLQSLYGMRVLEQGETPGLGGRIVEPQFLERFKGAVIRPDLKIVKFAQNVNEIDAISGASKTCSFLEIIINNAIATMDEVYKKD